MDRLMVTKAQFVRCADAMYDNAGKITALRNAVIEARIKAAEIEQLFNNLEIIACNNLGFKTIDIYDLTDDQYCEWEKEYKKLRVQSAYLEPNGTCIQDSECATVANNLINFVLDILPPDVSGYLRQGIKTSAVTWNSVFKFAMAE